MKGRSIFALTLLLAFVLCVALAPAQAAAPKDPLGVVTIKKGQPINIATWLVMAGPNSPLGIDVIRGVEIAIDEKGGQLLGHKIKLSSQDESCSPEGGQAAATKIASDPTVVAAVGANCSSAGLAGIPILWTAGICTISPSSTAPTLTDPQARGAGFEGFLRTAHNDKVQGAVAAEFAFKKLGVKRAATIHDGSSYADGLQAVFSETFKNLGGTITAQEAVSDTDTDMRPVLTKIATTKPEFIYYPIFISAAAHITRQVKEIPGIENVYLMGADGSFSPDFYKAAGQSATGMFHSSPDFSAFGDRYQEFVATHKKKFGEAPIAPYHAHGYDAAMIIFNAIEKVAVKDGDTLYIGREALRDAMFATKDMKGMTGNITCSEYGDCADPHIAIYQQTAENLKQLTNPTEPYWKPY